MNRSGRIFFLVFLSVLAAFRSEAANLCETRSIMTLSWTICLEDESKSKAVLAEAINRGMKELERIDGWMSEWKEKSEITKINNLAGIKPVPVSEEAFVAISKTLEQSRLTEGAFDISFNAFFGLYKWTPGKEKFPSDQEIKRLLPLVNWKNIVLDKKRKTVFLKKKGMKIGLGGMGEGWAVDKVVELLKPMNIQAGYVDGSGAVYVWGTRPGKRLWTIGIGNPRPMSSSQTELFKLYMTDIAVTTSGDTNKSFWKNGRLYHHIIDPKTGRSAQKALQVTAICQTATLCDLADNGIFILGPQKGFEYAKKLGVHAVLVDPARRVHLSEGLKPIKTDSGPGLQLARQPF